MRYPFLLHHSLRILAVLCVVTFAACSTVNDVTVIPQSKGSLTGTVHLGHPPYKVSQAGTIIQLVGSSLQGVTDSIGTFRIDSILPGSYSVLFSHPGYGTVKREELQIVTPGVTSLLTNPQDYLNLYPLPTAVIRSLSVDSFDQATGEWTLHLVTEPDIQPLPAQVVGMLTDVDPHTGTPSIVIKNIAWLNGANLVVAFYTELGDKPRIAPGTSWYLTTYLSTSGYIENPILSNSVKVTYPK